MSDYEGDGEGDMTLREQHKLMAATRDRQAVEVLKQQLRNIAECLGVIIKDWDARAKKLDDEETLRQLADDSRWPVVLRRQGEAIAMRRCAEELKGYVDTWPES